ncbi:LysR family transcriptional regulator [Sphingomonas ginkgonis]|uniref:LysR family transcriptional regulator n=1 Tax=Sphingomonas ginkgonis TaxID=2315330 RepID=A0A429V9M2_9SPHN|nr:LysR family transcriptional regulator [Sphingomonas ginkgonis]RST30659.1 LysR family transcriptional regulator [Sphingomonas ginkgonis]
MRLKGLDLNLLIALETLLDTRSVSRSAERMNLSQPAMSAALGRLRAFFGDELLTVSGKRMYPTPFAESLRPQVRETLRSVDELLATSVRFDPGSSQRGFRIAASDYVSTALLAPLLRRLAREAPGVRFEVIGPSEDSFRQLEDGRIDLIIAPDSFTLPGLPSELLVEERHVVAGWSQNPLLRSGLTLEAFLAAGHVSVAIGPRGGASFADRQLELIGLPRRIEVSVGSFTAVPWMLERTERLALLHERLAQSMLPHFDLAVAPLPFDFPLMREMLQWHGSRTQEAGVAWLRDQLHAAATTYSPW